MDPLGEQIEGGAVVSHELGVIGARAVPQCNQHLAIVYAGT